MRSGSLIVSVMLAVASLAGCSTNSTSTGQKAQNASATESRARIDDLYTATREHLGGTWKVGSETWLECTTASGSDGAAFDFLSQRRAQSLSGEPQAVAGQVHKIWAARGIHATISVDTSLNPPHYILSDPPFGSGSGAGGFLTQLTVSENKVTFTGTSKCVAGDINKLSNGG